MGAAIPVPVVVQVQLLERDLDVPGQRAKAPGALARDRDGRGAGGQDTLGHRLEPDVEIYVDADRDADELEAHVFGSRHGPVQGQ
jgi:hypothetical protein